MKRFCRATAPFLSGGILVKRIICLLLSLLLLAGAVGCQGSEETAALEDFIAEVNHTRSEALSAPFELPAPGSISPEEDFTESELDSLLTRKTYHEQITLEQALEDTNVLMRILKTSYGGYEYFGGDARFASAADAIEARLRALGTEGVSSGELDRILREELAFIEDSHFNISRKPMAFKEKYIFSDAEARDFLRDDEGFYTVIDGKRSHLSAEDEHLLRPTESGGRLVYGLFAVSEDAESLPSGLTLSGGRIDVSWQEVSAGESSGTGQVFTRLDRDGIPVLAIRRMSIAPADCRQTNELVRAAKEMRDAPVFILDLRNNLGGDLLVNYFFMLSVTGSLVNSGTGLVTRSSALNSRHDAVNAGDTADSSSLIEFYAENPALSESWFAARERGESIEENNVSSLFEREGYIFVLLGKNSFSASEYLLLELAGVKNVVFIGTNSSGCLLCGNVNARSPVYLPNSGKLVSYGQTLVASRYMDGFDSNGFMPDIFTRGDALDSAVALIKSSGLAASAGTEK